jgi:hypothetical protein
MTQEPRQKKHLWWDACGLRLTIIGAVVSLSFYYWLA